MKQESINIDDLEWKYVPIKYCEYKRASKNFIFLDPLDMDYIVSNVTLDSLSEEDRNLIIKNMSPTLEECARGSKDLRMSFLTNLMKLIVFRYMRHKLVATQSLSQASINFERRALQHYEALKSLKESLIGRRSLLEIDMPSIN